MGGFRHRVISVFLGLFWLYGMLALIANAGATHGGSAQPTPSGSASGSATSTTTYTTTWHGDPPPAMSRIHYPDHRASYSRLRVVKGSVRPYSPVQIALLKRTKSGDCWWRHPHRWVRAACNELNRHLKFSASGSRPWKWHPPRLRPSVGRIRSYTVFSFANYSGSPFREGFEAGRNRIRFEIR